MNGRTKQIEDNTRLADRMSKSPKDKRVKGLVILHRHLARLHHPHLHRRIPLDHP